MHGGWFPTQQSRRQVLLHWFIDKSWQIVKGNPAICGWSQLEMHSHWILPKSTRNLRLGSILPPRIINYMLLDPLYLLLVRRTLWASSHQWQLQQKQQNSYNNGSLEFPIFNSIFKQLKNITKRVSVLISLLANFFLKKRGANEV